MPTNGNAWEQSALPTSPGWYAVTRAYEEGLFPGAEEWKVGQAEWSDGRVLAWSPTSFPTKQTATDWAYEHDMEGPF